MQYKLRFFRQIYKAITISGEMSEWPKEHAWKVCIRQRIEGSNPSLSANK